VDLFERGILASLGLKEGKVAKSKESLQPQKTSDAWVQWVSQVAQGDESALASLYDSSSRLVYGLALRILGDRGAAEEVTLDVYLQVWRQANRFDSDRGRVSTWLIAMARSRVRQSWEKQISVQMGCVDGMVVG